jgi:hypothetical protein
MASKNISDTVKTETNAKSIKDDVNTFDNIFLLVIRIYYFLYINGIPSFVIPSAEIIICLHDELL